MKAAISTSHVYDVPEGDDYLAIYETLDRKEANATSGGIHKNKSHSMEDLETPTPSLKSFDLETGKQEEASRLKRQHRKEKSPSPASAASTVASSKPQMMMQPQGKITVVFRKQCLVPSKMYIAQHFIKECNKYTMYQLPLWPLKHILLCR